MILATDPGLKNFGVAILDNKRVLNVGVIKTKKNIKMGGRVSEDYEARIRSIYDRLRRITSYYPITEIHSELPPFGSQSANAAVSLTSGATIIIGLSALLNIPAKWASPRELKDKFTGNPNADKKVIMRRCCNMYNWPIKERPIFKKNSKQLVRTDYIYNVMGENIGAGKFEHIADALAAHYVIDKREGSKW